MLISQVKAVSLLSTAEKLKSTVVLEVLKRLMGFDKFIGPGTVPSLSTKYMIAGVILMLLTESFIWKVKLSTCPI